MQIPIMTLNSIIQDVIRLGALNQLADVSNPKIRELKKRIPLELSDIEKKYDKNFNDIILNEKIISRYLSEMMRQLFEERDLTFFTQIEREKDEIELIEYLKEKSHFEKITKEMIEAINRQIRNDQTTKENLQRAIALQAFVKALEAQNEILLAQRKEYVAAFVTSVVPELQEIAPYSQLSNEELSDISTRAFEEALEFDKEFDERVNNAGNINNHTPGISDNIDTTQRRVPAVSFAHQRPLGNEMHKTSVIKGIFIKISETIFNDKGIPYDKGDLDKGAEIFLNRFNEAKNPVYDIDDLVKENKEKITNTNNFINKDVGDLGSEMDLLGFMSDIGGSSNSPSIG